MENIIELKYKIPWGKGSTLPKDDSKLKQTIKIGNSEANDLKDIFVIYEDDTMIFLNKAKMEVYSNKKMIRGEGNTFHFEK